MRSVEQNSIGAALFCQVLNLVIVKKGEAEIPGLTGTPWPPFHPLDRLDICALREAPFPVLFVPFGTGPCGTSHTQSCTLHPTSNPNGGAVTHRTGSTKVVVSRPSASEPHGMT